MGDLTVDAFAGLEIDDAVSRDLVSTVYAAVDPDNHSPVNLRVVAADLSDPDADDHDLYQQFLTLARQALTFEHPNVLTTLEVGEYDQRGYLITERTDSVALADHIAQQGPIPPDAAIELFTSLADALDAAHRSGLTHGAVGPSTLRVVPGDYRGFVTGFGLGPLLELRLRRDRKQLRVLRDLLYVAPEQLRDQPTTGRADQYSLACALLHSLTGGPPFVRDSVGGLFGAHLFVTPAVDDDAPVDLPVFEALSKEPGERFASCRELMEAVARARGHTRSSKGLAEGTRDDDDADAPVDAVVAADHDAAADAETPAADGHGERGGDGSGSDVGDGERAIDATGGGDDPGSDVGDERGGEVRGDDGTGAPDDEAADTAEPAEGAHDKATPSDHRADRDGRDHARPIEADDPSAPPEAPSDGTKTTTVDESEIDTFETSGDERSPATKVNDVVRAQTEGEAAYDGRLDEDDELGPPMVGVWGPTSQGDFQPAGAEQAEAPDTEPNADVKAEDDNGDVRPVEDADREGVGSTDVGASNDDDEVESHEAADDRRDGEHGPDGAANGDRGTRQSTDAEDDDVIVLPELVATAHRRDDGVVGSPAHRNGAAQSEPEGVLRATVRADRAPTAGQATSQFQRPDDDADNSESDQSATAAMTYPTASEVYEPGRQDDSEEDLDDIPLLSEVLSRRPPPRQKASWISWVLVLLVIAAIAAVVAYVMTMR